MTVGQIPLRLKTIPSEAHSLHPRICRYRVGDADGHGPGECVSTVKIVFTRKPYASVRAARRAVPNGFCGFMNMSIP